MCQIPIIIPMLHASKSQRLLHAWSQIYVPKSSNTSLSIIKQISIMQYGVVIKQEIFCKILTMNILPHMSEL